MLNPTLARWLFFTAERFRGEDVKLYLDELERTQWYSPSELREWQWAKLTRLLHHAYHNVPWYHNKFNERGIRPEDISSPKDLTLLPILSKDDLRNNTSLLKAVNYRSKSSLIKTSGSTGISLKFARDLVSTGYGRAAMYRGHRWHNIDIGEKEARLWGVPIAFKDKIICYAGDFFLNRFRPSDFALSETVILNFLCRAGKSQPIFLTGYPSMVYQVALFLHQRTVPPPFSPRIIKVTAETLYDFQRELIEKIFNCPVINEYGAAEVGIIGFECSHRNIHVMMENIFLEGLNIDTPSDGNSDFIVTDLNNYTTPIIRYRIGDRGRLSVIPCECGRAHQLLETIQGRVSDIVFKMDGTPVHSSVFSYILKEITGVDGGIGQYKIFQDTIGNLRIDIVKGIDYKESTTALLKQLIFNKLDQDIQLEINFVEEITRDRSGKLRYFESTIDLQEKL